MDLKILYITMLSHKGYYYFADDIDDNKSVTCTIWDFFNVFFNNRPDLSVDEYHDVLELMKSTKDKETISFYVTFLTKYNFSKMSFSDVKFLYENAVLDYCTYTNITKFYLLITQLTHVLKPI